MTKWFLCLVLCVLLWSPAALQTPLYGDESGTALFKACMAGDADQVSALLKGGADANVVDKGISALMFAVHTGNADIARLLVNAGADINYKNADGVGALFIAAYSGNKEMVDALLSDKISGDDKFTAANIALLQNNSETAERLKEAAEYNALDYRTLRRGEYQSGGRFMAYYQVAHIFVDEESRYRAVCHLKEGKEGKPNENYVIYIESKERFPFIEGDNMEGLLTYISLQKVEVSALPYRSMEQALFQLDKIVALW